MISFSQSNPGLSPGPRPYCGKYVSWPRSVIPSTKVTPSTLFRAGSERKSNGLRAGSERSAAESKDLAAHGASLIIPKMDRIAWKFLSKTGPYYWGQRSALPGLSARLL